MHINQGLKKLNKYSSTKKKDNYKNLTIIANIHIIYDVQNHGKHYIKKNKRIRKQTLNKKINKNQIGFTEGKGCEINLLKL